MPTLRKKDFRTWLASLPPDAPLPRDPDGRACCPLERWLWAEHGAPRPWVSGGTYTRDADRLRYGHLPLWAWRFTRTLDGAGGFDAWDWQARDVLAVLDGGRP